MSSAKQVFGVKITLTTFVELPANDVIFLHVMRLKVSIGIVNTLHIYNNQFIQSKLLCRESRMVPK